MARVNSLLHAFNRGVVSKQGLGRVDVDRLRLSAEGMTNWIPTKLGPMHLRPGLQYLGSTKGNSAIEPIPFIASLDEMNLLELGSGVMRVRDVATDTLVTRNAVPTIVKSLRVSGAFTTSSAGNGSASLTNGKLVLTGGGHGGWAKAKQTITVLSAYANTEHAIRIVVQRGPVLIRIGSADEGEQYLKETALMAGVHSLAFTPRQSGNNNSIYLQFESRDTPSRIISAVTGETSARTLEIPIPWDANDLPNVRWAQSADVMFLACEGKKPQRIERRGATSWSVVDWDSYDGPFHIQPTSNISLTPSATEGNITLTASRAMWKAAHVGTLIRLFQNGQSQSTALSGENQFCQPVRVTGTHAEFQSRTLSNRTFEYQISHKGGEQLKNGNFSAQKEWTGLGTGTDGNPLPWQYGKSKIGKNTVPAALCDNSASSSTASITETVALDAATGYTLTFRITENGKTGTGLLFYVGGVVNGSSTLQNKLGVQTLTFTTGGSGVPQTFEIRASAGWKGAITNLSLKPTTFTGWVGNVSLQRSIDGPDAGFTTILTFNDGTAGYPNKWATFNDTTGNESDQNFDNVICWYRLGLETGNYTSGTVTVKMRYGPGSGAGVIKINSITSTTVANGEVVHGGAASSNFPTLTSTSATYDWFEGEFSDNQIWPTSVELFEGRLWYGARDKMYGSVSDAFTSYDYEKEGDASPIIRSIGAGPVQGISGIIGLQRLVALGALSELSVRSSAFDEPLTPTNFTLKQCSTIGSHSTQPVKVDSRGIYIGRSQRRLYELAFSGQSQDYESHDLTAFVPNFGDSDFIRFAVQRQPDTRIHVVRDDGTVACLLFEPDEQILAWFDIDTSLGTNAKIERVVVLPGNIEDQVYYVVRRTINGSTVRYIEKFARQDQCVGGTLNYQADSFVVISQASSTTITGLDHLEGEDVVIWAAGKDLGTKTVSNGRVTGVSQAVTSAIVGLSYVADYKSAKLAYGAQAGTAINQVKRISHLGFVLADTHYQGLTYGPDTDNLKALPLNEDGNETSADTIWDQYDQPTFAINGDWDTDSRLCLRAAAPRPCTVCAATVGIETHES